MALAELSSNRVTEVASGIDALYLSGRADLPPGLALALDEHRERAADDDAPVPFEALGEGSSDGDPGVRALFVTLAAGVRSGTPVIPALQRLGDSERTRRRRRTQARVRRLAITMLVPLVLLVLPAFVLLTIVPVLLSVARTGLVPAST